MRHFLEVVIFSEMHKPTGCPLFESLSKCFVRGLADLGQSEVQQGVTHY